MSTTLILPPAEITGRAAAELAAHASDAPRANAINKAAYYLATGDAAIVETFGGFLVTSATRPGTVHRVSAVSGCSCEAAQRGRVCWHAAAIQILEEAGRYALLSTMPKLTSRRIVDAELDALSAELFG